MEITPERLVALPDSGPLHPAYLVAGPEMLRVLEAADAVRRMARAQGIGEREIFDVEGRDFDWGNVEAAFNAPSLFSARRLVELRLPSGKPGKDGEKVILGFCANPPPDVVLLVTAGECGKALQGKWSEAIGKIGLVAIAWAVKPHELAGWVESRLRAKGLRAEREAVQVLVERVEGNLLAAAQEIDKLALLAGNDAVTAQSMHALVADAARYDVFRLADAMLDGQAAQVSRMLAGLRAEGDAVAGLMPILVRELLRAVALARVQAVGGNLGTEMKAQGIWDTRQAPFKRALQRHPNPLRWERFIAVASRIDRMAKGRADGDAWVALERLLLVVADAKAVRLLVA